MTADADMDGGNDTLFAPASSSSGLEYSLHPLVLINISDHFTRIRMAGTAQPRVIGCLIGEQSGRCVDVSNSFEMVASGTAENPDFDRSVFNDKLGQYTEVYKDLTVLGWYSTGGPVSQADLLLHKKFMEFNDVQAPIFLLMDPANVMVPAAKELPVEMFETVVHVLDGAPQTMFAKATFAMATSDAERIAVNAAASSTPSGAGTDSALSQHYSTLQSALVMLAERVEIILAYCRDMESGKVPINHEVMRMVQGLLNQMPMMPSPEFKRDLAAEHAEVELISVLCMITKGVDACHSLVQSATDAYKRN